MPGTRVRPLAGSSINLVPGIHAFFSLSKTWMAGTGPAMTARGKIDDRQRLRPAHGALQSLAEREPLRRRRPALGGGAAAGARRLLRLDPQNAEPSALGRPHLDEPLHRRAAAAGRHSGIGFA